MIQTTLDNQDFLTMRMIQMIIMMKSILIMIMTAMTKVAIIMIQMIMISVLMTTLRVVLTLRIDFARFGLYCGLLVVARSWASTKHRFYLGGAEGSLTPPPLL